MTEEKSPLKGKILSALQEQVLMKQMLPLVLTGQNATQMAKALKVGKSVIDRISGKDEFKKLVDDATDEQILPIITRARMELSKLVHKALRVVDHHLDNNNLDAAKTVFKAIGLEHQEVERRDAPINIIMPGQVVEHAVTAEVQDAAE